MSLTEFPLLVCEAAQQCQFEAEEAGITLFTPIPEPYPAIDGESSLLTRLLAHAIRFGIVVCMVRGRDQINLLIEQLPDAVQATIELPDVTLAVHEQALIDALFSNNDPQAFRQLEYGTNLTIVKGLTDLHNGQIEFEQDEATCRLMLRFPIINSSSLDDPTTS